jgi:uncharacterized membrane protein YfcA
MIPAIVIGAVAGIRIVRIFPEKAYRYFLIATTAASAIIIIIK